MGPVAILQTAALLCLTLHAVDIYANVVTRQEPSQQKQLGQNLNENILSPKYVISSLERDNTPHNTSLENEAHKLDKREAGTVAPSGVNPCESSPCKNSGNCRPQTHNHNRYRCICTDEFEGTNCELRKDPCKDNDCKNGATCVKNKDGTFKYSCSCVLGYVGDRCENEADPCVSSPCLNDGICSKHMTAFYCSCKDGYVGPDCGKSLVACTENKCKHGGTCHNLGNAKYECHCGPHFKGHNCDLRINICVEANPCLNNGKCESTDLDLLENLEKSMGKSVPEHEDYQCLCSALFTGKHCETKIDPCISAPCENDGVCKKLSHLNAANGNAPFICDCVGGFSGPRCQNVGSCDTKPCVNGGTCKDSGAGFVCFCHYMWTGMVCQTKKTSCTENPCPPTKECEDVRGETYTCFVRSSGQEVAVFKEETPPPLEEEDGNISLIIGFMLATSALMSVLAVGGILFWKRHQDTTAMKESFFQKLRESQAGMGQIDGRVSVKPRTSTQPIVPETEQLLFGGEGEGEAEGGNLMDGLPPEDEFEGFEGAAPEDAEEGEED